MFVLSRVERSIITCHWYRLGHKGAGTGELITSLRWQAVRYDIYISNVSQNSLTLAWRMGPWARARDSSATGSRSNMQSWLFYCSEWLIIELLWTCQNSLTVIIGAPVTYVLVSPYRLTAKPALVSCYGDQQLYKVILTLMKFHDHGV